MDHENWGVNQITESEDTAKIHNLPMATIKTQSPAVIPTPDEIEIEETPADRIARMLTSVSDDERAEVRVYRKAKPGFAMEWCKNYSPEEFEAGGNLAMIRRDWGPGLYQIRLYATHPTSRIFCVRAREDVSIADDPSSKQAPVNQPSNESERLIAMMIDQNAKILEKLAEKPDPMANFAQTMALMAQVKNLFGSDNAKTPIGEIVSAIKELKGAAEEIAPPTKEEPTNLLDLGAQLLGMIKDTQAANATAAQIPIVAAPPIIANTPVRPQPQPQIIPQSQPQAIPQSQAQVTPQPQPENDMNVLAAINLLKQQLAELVQMAVDNKSIEESADFVYDRLPDEAIELLFADNWFELLCQFEPACTPHKEWMQKVRDKTIEYFNEDSVDDPVENPISVTDPGLVKP